MSNASAIASHPTRVRGLKLLKFMWLIVSIGVAPHAGAWIETSGQADGTCGSEVAPHAGAWIETRFVQKSIEEFKVAPHAGAWIET